MTLIIGTKASTQTMQSDVGFSLPTKLHFLTPSPFIYITKISSSNLVVIQPFQQHFSHIRTMGGYTVKILKFGTPQTIAIIVLKIEKFDVTLH